MPHMEGDAPGLKGLGTVPIYLMEKTPYGTFECQSSPHNRKMIGELIETHPHGDFCEIGIFGGINMFALYDTCKKHNMGVIGIDPHDSSVCFNGVPASEIEDNLTSTRYPLWKKFRENIEKTITEHKLDIRYINDTSWNCHPLIKDESLSVLHIDGDHSYDGITKDFELFYPKMKNNGVILVDDYTWDGVHRGTNDFVKKNNLKTELLNNGEYLKIFVEK